MLSDIPAEDFAAAVDASANEVLWEAGIDGPPIDALDVAEGLQLVVARDYSLLHRGHFVRLADRSGGVAAQGTIVVGPSNRCEREQWTVAHEIGESIVYRVFDRLGVVFDEVTPTARESAANCLASALLLPRRWFAVDGPDVGWNLIELKERYCTASHELVARRMLEMRPAIVISVFDQGRLQWRRGNVGQPPVELLNEERAAWRTAHLLGTSAEASLDAESGLQRVDCWPVHEPGWKRESMRSEMAEMV